MPFQSEKQRRYMHANLPDIANRWEAKYGLGGVAGLNAQLNSLPEYYMPFPAAHGGLIPAHEAGIYGLAEGGTTGKTRTRKHKDIKDGTQELVLHKLQKLDRQIVVVTEDIRKCSSHRNWRTVTQTSQEEQQLRLQIRWLSRSNYKLQDRQRKQDLRDTYYERRRRKI